MAEPADESISPDLNCPTCGSAWHVDAAACGNCGWRLQAAGPSGTLSAPCPQRHQSKYVDSLTGRCTRCQPIRINDIQPELQDYAQSAQSQRYKEFAVMMLIGPVGIAICAYYSKGGLSTPLVVSLVLTPIIMGASVYSLIRKSKLSLRYYRLGFVMRYAKPVDAELQYEVRGRGSEHRTHCYFNLCRLGPDSLWPSGVDKKISVDIPSNKNEKTVTTKDFWKKLYQGFDPREKPTLWAKVYFDPDQSGSAVIRIGDSVFVSVNENNRFI